MKRREFTEKQRRGLALQVLDLPRQGERDGRLPLRLDGTDIERAFSGTAAEKGGENRFPVYVGGLELRKDGGGYHFAVETTHDGETRIERWTPIEVADMVEHRSARLGDGRRLEHFFKQW